MLNTLANSGGPLTDWASLNTPPNSHNQRTTELSNPTPEDLYNIEPEGQVFKVETLRLNTERFQPPRIYETLNSEGRDTKVETSRLREDETSKGRDTKPRLYG